MVNLDGFYYQYFQMSVIASLLSFKHSSQLNRLCRRIVNRNYGLMSHYRSNGREIHENLSFGNLVGFNRLCSATTKDTDAEKNEAAKSSEEDSESSKTDEEKEEIPIENKKTWKEVVSGVLGKFSWENEKIKWVEAFHEVSGKSGVSIQRKAHPTIDNVHDDLDNWRDSDDDSKPSSTSEQSAAIFSDNMWVQPLRKVVKLPEVKAKKQEGSERSATSSVTTIKDTPDPWKDVMEKLKSTEVGQQASMLKTGFSKTNLGQQTAQASLAISKNMSDAKHFWENSQSPVVYKLSSAVDSISKENDEGFVTRQLRRLDPAFDLEHFVMDTEGFINDLVSLMLADAASSSSTSIYSGRLKTLTQSGLYSRLAKESDIRTNERKSIVIGKVLDVERPSFGGLTRDLSEDRLDDIPLIMVHTYVLQLYCVKNENGEVVEGSEEKVRAQLYILALKREYLHETNEIQWKCADIVASDQNSYFMTM